MVAPSPITACSMWQKDLMVTLSAMVTPSPMVTNGWMMTSLPILVSVDRNTLLGSTRVTPFSRAWFLNLV